MAPTTSVVPPSSNGLRAIHDPHFPLGNLLGNFPEAGQHFELFQLLGVL